MIKIKSQSGSLLVDALLASALLSLILLGVISVVGLSSESGLIDSNHNRALAYAQEGLSGVASISQRDFAELIPGTYGIDISGSWSLVGLPTTFDIFERSVTITEPTPDIRLATADISWQGLRGVNRSIDLSNIFTDWRRDLPVCPETHADYFSIDANSISISNNGKTISNLLTSVNDLDCSIELDTISITFALVTNNKTRRIRINGSNVWSGNVASGVLIDHTNVILDAITPVGDYEIRFQKNASGDTLDFDFGFADGSIAQINGIILP
ncbi:MAG: hypothetical protein OEX08_02270 [Candidatus Nomurabacteria bacterium]|nr:hypothetical protein [Candidatus Nomurabacteria bacterium]